MIMEEKFDVVWNEVEEMILIKSRGNIKLKVGIQRNLVRVVSYGEKYVIVL